jgi:hypothetical protein
MDVSLYPRFVLSAWPRSGEGSFSLSTLLRQSNRSDSNSRTSHCFFNSANFTLDVPRYTQIQETYGDDLPSVGEIAQGMGEMLGRFHWRSGYDGRRCRWGHVLVLVSCLHRRRNSHRPSHSYTFSNASVGQVKSSCPMFVKLLINLANQYQLIMFIVHETLHLKIHTGVIFFPWSLYQE